MRSYNNNNDHVISQDTWVEFFKLIGVTLIEDPDNLEDCDCVMTDSPKNIFARKSRMADKAKDLSLPLVDEVWLKQCLVCQCVLPFECLDKSDPE